MKRPSRKSLLFNLFFFGGVVIAIGIVIVGRKVAAAGALAAPPALKPWVYAGGLATMWGMVAAAIVMKRSGLLGQENRPNQTILVIINVAAFAAVVMGFFAAVFNVPASENPVVRLILFGVAMASAAATSRLVAI